MSGYAIKKKINFSNLPRSLGNCNRVLFFILFTFTLGNIFGQAPIYTHDAANSRNLDNFSITLADAFNPQAKLNRMVIAVDTNPEGERFVLTFGNGIKRVGDNDGYIDFIPNQNNLLSNPMDFAINSEGKFFVATNESNRRFIRVYSPTGVYLPNETLGDGSYGSGPNKFRGPTGLAFDKDDNLYVADHYIGDENPARPSFIKIYSKDGSGNYKNNLLKEFDNIQGTILNFPYRLAVNSQGHLYMAELGQDSNAKVKILQFDAGFTPTQIGEITGLASQIGSPGSIIIDKFDYIFIADLGSELGLSRVLEATNDVDEFFAIFEIIKRGIQDNVFNINVYNPNNSFNRKISSQIDLPVDLAISKCGTLYVNNAIFDGTITTFLGQRIPNITIDFDLEAYQRSPGYDQEDPVISCIDNIEVPVLEGQTYAIVDFETPVATDNCPGVTVTRTEGPASGSQFTTGTHTIEFTATDAAGNTAVCSFTITVIGEEPPLQFDNCPEEPIIQSAEVNSCGATVNYNIPTASGAGEVEVIRIDEGPANNSIFPVGNYTIIYEARDGINDPVICSFAIEVRDAQDPVFTNCPTNITREIPADETSAIVDFTAPVADDNCPGVTVVRTQGPASGSQFEAGTTTTIEFTATDAAGNTSTCSFTITVNREDQPPPPVFENCPTSRTLTTDLNACGAVVNFDAPTASGDNVTVNRIDSGPLSGELFPVGTTTVQFEANDGINDPVICSFAIEVRDAQDPVFTNCPSNITREIPADETFAIVDFTAPVADDNCAGVTVTRTQGPASGSQFEAGTTTTIEFTATDAAGNTSTCRFDITVTREGQPQPPVFENCPTSRTLNTDLNACGAVVNFDAPTASGENVTVNRIDSGPLSGELFPIGTTTVEFEAKDGINDPVICSFTIEVRDAQDPVFTNCPSNITREIPADETFAIVDFTAPVADDNCPGVTVTRTQGPASGSQFEAGTTTTIEFTATDAAGNTSTCRFDITVTREGQPQPPVFENCPGTISINTSPDACDAMVTFSNPTAIGENVTVSRVDDGPASGERFPVGTTIVVFEANDGINDPVTCSFEIQVIDNTLPIARCVGSYQVWLDQNGIASLTPSAIDGGSSDNCSNVSLSIDRNSFTTADIGDQIVTLTVTDEEGNEDQCETIVTVNPYEEGTDPEITCRSEVVLDLDETGNASLSASELYTGNGNDINFSLSQQNFNCSHIGSNTITLSWSGNGVSGSCEINVEVRDVLPPVVRTRNISVFLNEQGQTTITPQLINDGTTDNCGELSLSLDINRFTCKDLGENTVLLIATDENGNTASAPAIVTVTGTCEVEPPPVGDKVDHIVIYPNPTQGPIQIARPPGVTIQRIEVFDFRGRFMLANDFPENTVTYQMDLTGLQQAVYVLNIITSTGNVIRRVIIY